MSRVTKRGGVNEGAVPKFLENTLLDIGSGKMIFASPMNGFIVVFKPFLWVKDGFKHFPFNVEERAHGRQWPRQWQRHTQPNLQRVAPCPQPWHVRLL